ncbi:uncharacterized protein LOC110017406 [Oryzias latipes]|uniref:uncharacterized protein LOC110017406 n=1 Tax=Oryzias latipes TaxID=8090 RepID=UPI0009DA5770|nr:uncharacterized protein LOC110017406 [Oryzias latipes]
MNRLESSSTNMNLEFIWKLFEKLRRPLVLFLLLVLTSILQHIFDMHFVCSCRPGLHVNGVLYLVLPSLILTFAVYVVRKFYKKKVFSTVDCCPREPCSWTCFSFGKRVYEFLSLTGLWIAMVLFDGDWYFCLRTNFNSNQTGLPCKKNLTYEEERIKDSYKTESLDWGLGLCCGLLLIWSLVEKYRTQIRSKCWCSRPYYKPKYKKILSEELSSFIEKQLKEIAMAKAQKMLMPKIEVIRNHELSENNRRESGVSQTWKDISDPSFILEYQKMTESNPTTNTEMSDLSETPGKIQDGQEGLNLGTLQDSHEEAGGSGQGKPAIFSGIKKASSSSSFRNCGGGDEVHLEKARPNCADSASGGVAAAVEGSVGEGQPHTMSTERPSVDLADCSDPMEEGAQPGGESGESGVSGEGVSGDGQVEGQVSQVAEGGVLVGGIVSGVFEVVDELKVNSKASGVDGVCVDEGGVETSEWCDSSVSGECVVGDGDACLQGGD